jgi:hypothetical protein
METLQRTANRGSISTGFDIDNSVKLEPDNTEYLSRTIGSTSNRKTFTVSCWFKRTELKSGAADANGHNLFFSGVDSTNMVSMQFHTWQDTNADKLEFRVVGSTNNYTSRRFRDTSAWYHIVLAVDTTQATESNRWKLYVNGVQETAFDATSYPSQNADTVNNVQNNVMRIGTKPYAGNEFGYFAGYIADYYHIDGEALAPTDFGEFDEDSGIWKPKAYTGSFGTNGWYLDFVDGADLGDDESGNGNDFTENNITAADQATDTPTNNFCIGNALINFAPGGQTLVRGGTKFSNPSGQNWQTITGTFGLTSGKWYWEFESDGTGAFVGISDVQDSIIPQNTGGYFLGYGDDNSSTTKSLGMYSANGVIYNDSGSATGGSYGSGNRVGVALDMDNRKIYFAVDNTWVNSGDPANGTNGATWNTSWSDTVFPAGSCAQNNSIFFVYGGFSSLSNISNVDANGYGGFYYTPPSGYYALCSRNLSEFG